MGVWFALSVSYHDFFNLHVQVVAQQYDTDVNKEYVIMGNSIILKCQVPSFVADFVDVLSWHTDENEDFYPGENYGYFIVYLLQACSILPFPYHQ